MQRNTFKKPKKEIRTKERVKEFKNEQTKKQEKRW